MALTSNSDPLLLGAVAYDPKVITIWDGFKLWFEQNGLAFDYVLYSNYERQVEAQLAGHVHVAWDSPLAWIQTERLAARLGRRAEAFAMRDTDRDLRSVIVVRADSPIQSVAQLAGRRVAVGAADSPQATLIPLLLLAEAGLDVRADLQVERHDLLVGKHGDHVGGEREAARALTEGRADAACLIDGNLLAFAAEGTLPAGSVRVLASTPAYDHCVFVALDGAPAEPLARFTALLMSMDYGDAAVRPLLDLEGLKAWRPGRTSGFAQLNAAVNAFGTIQPWLEAAAARLGA